ncbi:MAG: outer membrane lipoprotein-sorting protein [Bacteroidota bacterium]
MKNIKIVFTTMLLVLLAVGLYAQESDPKAIVEKSDNKLKGLTSFSEMKMTIVRPSWTREMQLKTWSKGDDLGLILVTAPVRDKGTAFLRREKEIWNWQPNIDRIIKLPPSMMMQSWMGSDFTNDDLVKQSSVVDDYTHKLLSKEEVEGRNCYKIEMIPTEDAAVVWGKVIMWIDVKEYMQMKVAFFDEDDYLVNTMYGKQVKKMGGKLLPSILEIEPADEDGHKTIVEYLSLTFDQPLKENFFSTQNMKRVR